MNSDKVRKTKMKYQNSDKGRKRHNQAQRAWKKRQKVKALNYKGNKCCKCGYDKCLEALDFHHLSPEKKTIGISVAFRNSWKWDRLKIELDKCILLCANCHRELHSME